MTQSLYTRLWGDPSGGRGPSIGRGPSGGRGPSTLIHLSIPLLLLLGLMSVPAAMGQDIEVRKHIKEELLPGTVIANLATEPDVVAILQNSGIPTTGDATTSSAKKLQYSLLTSGNPSSQYFSVEPETGVVSILSTIDRERVCSFRPECQLNFEVAARSVYGVFFLLVDVAMMISDINDNPPEFTQSQFELFVPENSDSGRTFQLPTAFDRDTGPGNGVTEYRILRGPTLFGLETRESGYNTSDLFIKLETMVNRETASAYQVLVGAVDGGVPQLTGTLTLEVHVSDINDNFPVFEQPIYLVNIAEDTGKDHGILTVKAMDADSGANGDLLYTFSALQPTEDLAYFRIDQDSGEIFLTQSIETRAGDTITLVVEASDMGHPPKVSRCRVQIQVDDTINSMPEVIVDTLSGTEGVAEVSEYGEIGKVVAHVSVRDSDSGDNGRTDCSLSGPEFKLVKLDDAGKYKAVLMAALDREITESYHVTVSCSDHGFPSLLASETFLVRVLDENDQTPRFSERRIDSSIFENNTVGALITQLTVTDGDIGLNSKIVYEVMGVNSQYFAVDHTGRMTAKVPLDREYSDRIVAQVKATDQGKPPLSAIATVVVTLMDINDMRPRFNQMVYEFEVEEEQPVGRFVGIVSASDEDLDENQDIFYHLPTSYSQGENQFVVGIDGGVIKTNKVLDREEKERHEFLVLATDRGEPPLTGTARVIIKVKDVNDNDPEFQFPNPKNRSITIPHTFASHSVIVYVVAVDNDSGMNAELVYSVSSINGSTPFAVDDQTGELFLDEELAPEDVGTYTLTLMAHDQGERQRANQFPLDVDVYFDNSTLLAASAGAGASGKLIVAVTVVCVVIVIGIIILTIFLCIRRREAKKQGGGVPNSASTSSTAKLHGGYYIAPGVRGSSSSFLAKHEDGTCNSTRSQTEDPAKSSNPYVVMVPASRAQGDQAVPQIIQISRNGNMHGLNDTQNTIDLDQTDDGQFSTFKSQEDILSPGLRQGGSLRRQSTDTTDAKRRNDTFDTDDMSCDSTSDSGRGGSDLDNNAAAAANKEKAARAQAATPISMKSGISNRLSPLPREHERTFLTFRGDSPSSFRFDSDSDTLTRPQRSLLGGPMPMMSSPSRRDVPRFEPGQTSSLSRHSESDTDTDLTPRNRSYPHPMSMAGIHNPHSSLTAGAGEGAPMRHPIRVTPLPMFMTSGGYHRHDSETDHSDGGSNQSNSLSRRNHVPRLPSYPGIEFSHHAYGSSCRNSIGALSNNSATDGYIPDPNRGVYPGDNGSSPRYIGSFPNNGSSYPTTFDYNNDLGTNVMPDIRVSTNYGNVVSELQDSRPVSMEDDTLLPPYPEMDEEEEESEALAMHSGYTGMSPERDTERATLFSRSKFETSA